MFRSMRLSASAAILCVLGACAANSSNDLPVTGVGLMAAEQTAVAYMTLPTCGTAGASAVCSDPTVKHQVRVAVDNAVAAYQKAETIAAAPGSSASDVQLATTAASAALATLVQLTNTLPQPAKTQ